MWWALPPRFLQRRVHHPSPVSNFPSLGDTNSVLSVVHQDHLPNTWGFVRWLWLDITVVWLNWTTIIREELYSQNLLLWIQVTFTTFGYLQWVHWDSTTFILSGIWDYTEHVLAVLHSTLNHLLLTDEYRKELRVGYISSPGRASKILLLRQLTLEFAEVTCADMAWKLTLRVLYTAEPRTI